jgi:hypothetical protein
MLNVTVCVDAVLLINAPVILPLPLFPIPVTVVVFLVQLYTVPVTSLLKLIGVMVAPLHIV